MPSLLEAIERKYGYEEEIEGEIEAEYTLLEKEERSRKKKERCLSVAIFVPRRDARSCVPSLLVLNNCAIETAGELLDKCSAVEELDLAGNMLTDWTEALAILSSMPKLRFVNLSFNQLGGDLTNSASKWERLHSLVLNSTNTEWDCVKSLLDSCPKLQELHLSLNGYGTVDLSTEEHHEIRKLHFAGNPVNDWFQVNKLGKAFPNLESLVLAECPLPGPKSGDEQNFLRLKALNLDGTLLATWLELEQLATFPVLESVRVRNCLAGEDTEYERRQLLVARLPQVRVLNGGPVEIRERDDAERAFIRHYAEIPEADRPSRYNELVAIHGHLDPLVNVDLRPDKKVSITFTCGNLSETRTVDVYRSVSDLKQKLESFAGIAPSRMRLFYVDQDMRHIQGPEEMKYPSKQLYSYNIRNGDEIIIDIKRNVQRTTSLSSSPKNH